MPKYASKFNVALKKEYPFLKCKSGSESEVTCEICSSSLNISVRGRGDIAVHIKTAKYLKALETIRSNQTLDKMLVKSASMALQAKELTFAYHSGKHQVSGRTSDCNSKLITKCFEPKFTSGKTKTAKLIQKVNTISN